MEWKPIDNCSSNHGSDDWAMIDAVSYNRSSSHSRLLLVHYLNSALAYSQIELIILLNEFVNKITTSSLVTNNFTKEFACGEKGK